jgi:hypothetical protein
MTEGGWDTPTARSPVEEDIISMLSLVEHGSMSFDFLSRGWADRY